MNRGIVVLTALMAGLILGLFAGAYIYYAWMPPDSILKNASPKYLNFDSTNLTPQYRDFYIVRAAEKYQRGLQQGLPNPLQGAYDVLGVTTGDTTIDEAITMVRLTEKVANHEVNIAGDTGQFTRNEQLALVALGDALVSARQSGNYPKVDPSKYPPLVARTTTRIIGLLIFVLLAGVAGGAIYLVDHSVKSRAPSVAGVLNEPQTLPVADYQDHPTTPLASPAQQPITVPHNIAVNMNPTSPGTAGSAFGTAQPHTSVPVAPAEAPIASFAPTVYRHGDDHYDEDFAINGAMGELIGECGASIADRIGLDSPSRVSALSLWVFDKNDFQSTAKLLLTDFGWNDPVTRSKLKARGEAVQAMDGGVVEILTSMLRVEVQVHDLVLNSDNNPPNGYFQSVTLTFTVYKRQPAA